MKALIVGRPARSSVAQIWPFHAFRGDLAELYDFHFEERTAIAAADLESGGDFAGFDLVFLSLKIFGHDPEGLVRTLNRIPCRKVLLDDYDSTGNCRFLVAPLIDLYLKKQVLRERRGYRFLHEKERPHADYVRFSALQESTPVEVPPCFFEKLYCGWNLATNRYLHEGPASKHVSVDGNRPIDISMRASSTNGDPEHYYTVHRQKAFAALSRLGKTHNVVCTDEPVHPRLYFGELRRSKLALSPWGYGEICYRDFEAVLAGALLVKPSMEHVETHPDIFLPHQTYAPVRPDFSDLAEVCARYLSREEERRSVARAAFSAFQRYFRERTFLSQMGQILGRLFGDWGTVASPLLPSETPPQRPA